jgi:hypothetical protein
LERNPGKNGESKAGSRHQHRTQMRLRRQPAFEQPCEVVVEMNHEDLTDLKESFAGCMESKRFCLLCMGAALRGAASLRESCGKATPAGLLDA